MEKLMRNYESIERFTAAMSSSRMVRRFQINRGKLPPTKFHPPSNFYVSVLLCDFAGLTGRSNIHTVSALQFPQRGNG
jgi:hypothetical protein